MKPPYHNVPRLSPPYAAVAATGDETEPLDYKIFVTCIYKLGFRLGVASKSTHISVCKRDLYLIYF